MSHRFRPAVAGQAPIFVMISGGTGTGKSWSALRLARGMVGPAGKIAALDTEGGRLSSLANHHNFDMQIMAAPFRPSRFAEEAENAEVDGYDALVIDSASMLHVGPGGYRDWHQQEVTRVLERKKRFEAALDVEDESEREKVSWSARRVPSLDRQDMLYRMLQRRIPIIYACRARELTEKVGPKIVPIGWQPVIHDEMPYEMTVAITLTPDAGKGVVTRQKPWKIDNDHLEIFREGAVIDEAMGAAFMATMRRQAAEAPAFTAIRSDGKVIGFRDISGWQQWWDRAIASAPEEALTALRETNGALMGEYAEAHGDAVMAVQKAITARLTKQEAA